MPANRYSDVITLGALGIIAANSALDGLDRALPDAFAVFAGRADSTTAPGSFTSGEAAVLVESGVGAHAVLKNGRLTLSAPSAAAASWWGTAAAQAAPATMARGRFAFLGGTTGGGTVRLILADGVPVLSGNAPSYAAQLAVTLTSWELSVYDGHDHGNTGKHVLGSGALALNADQDYEAVAWIDTASGTARVRLPDGSTQDFTDSRITTYAGNYAFLESAVAASTDAVPAWSKFLVDTGKVNFGGPGVLYADSLDAGPIGIQSQRAVIARQALPASATYLAMNMAVADDELMVGSRFRITLAFANAGTSNNTTVAVKWGAAGAAGDANLASLAFTGTANADTAKLVIDVTVDAVDASAGSMTVVAALARTLSGGTTGFHNVAGTPVIANQATAIDTADAGFIGVSVTASAASTLTLLSGLIERVV